MLRLLGLLQPVELLPRVVPLRPVVLLRSVELQQRVVLLRFVVLLQLAGLPLDDGAALDSLRRTSLHATGHRMKHSGDGHMHYIRTAADLGHWDGFDQMRKWPIGDAHILNRCSSHP